MANTKCGDGEHEMRGWRTRNAGMANSKYRMFLTFWVWGFRNHRRLTVFFDEDMNRATRFQSVLLHFQIVLQATTGVDQFNFEWTQLDMIGNVLPKFWHSLQVLQECNNCKNTFVENFKTVLQCCRYQTSQCSSKYLRETFHIKVEARRFLIWIEN